VISGGKSSEVRNATILVLVGSAFQIYFGYQSYVLSEILLHPALLTVSVIMFVLGIVSFFTSMTVWLLKPRAAKTIVGVGGAICVAHVMFGYYLTAILVFIIYWVATDQIRINLVLKPHDSQDN
jgi:Ni,Fe-hydrogenase I cytochrome b subunit